MAKTQWHPLFADLLRPVLGPYYDVQTEVPVSDLPRRGDFLIVRRQPDAEPPFEGVWRFLTEWNVVEFKGMTDDPEEDDLELLMHVGCGLAYKINEERRERREPRLAPRQVSFWLIARQIGEAFLRHAAVRGAFPYEPGGIWRGTSWGHPIVLVSGRELHAEIDSLPLLTMDAGRLPRSLGEMVAQNDELLKAYAEHLRVYQPALWKVVKSMAQYRGSQIDWQAVFENEDPADAVRALPPQRVIEALGVEKAIAAIGIDKVIESVGRSRVIEAIGMAKFIEAYGERNLLAELLARVPEEEVRRLLERKGTGDVEPPSS